MKGNIVIIPDYENISYRKLIYRSPIGKGKNFVPCIGKEIN